MARARGNKQQEKLKNNKEFVNNAHFGKSMI